MPIEPMICDTAGALAVSPRYAHPNAWLLTVIGGRLSLVLDVSSTSDHRAHLTRAQVRGTRFSRLRKDSVNTVGTPVHY